MSALASITSSVFSPAFLIVSPPSLAEEYSVPVAVVSTTSISGNDYAFATVSDAPLSTMKLTISNCSLLTAFSSCMNSG